MGREGIIIAKNQKGGRMNRNVQKIKENVREGGRFFQKGGGNNIELAGEYIPLPIPVKDGLQL